MGRTQVVYDSKIAQDINTKLLKLAANPKRFSVKQIVEQVQDGIVLALDAGHDWDEILAVFSEYNIELKKTTVQRYLRQFRSRLDNPLPSSSSPSSTRDAASKDASVTV